MSWAGVSLTSYDEIKLTVSHAADLLGVHRGALDHAIWSYVSRSKAQNHSIGPECGHSVRAGLLSKRRGRIVFGRLVIALPPQR